jgi:hypothetical protein
VAHVFQRSSCAPVFDLLGHGQEGLFDIGRVLGRGLEEGNAEFIRKRLKLSAAMSQV